LTFTGSRTTVVVSDSRSDLYAATSAVEAAIDVLAKDWRRGRAEYTPCPPLSYQVDGLEFVVRCQPTGQEDLPVSVRCVRLEVRRGSTSDPILFADIRVFDRRPPARSSVVVDTWNPVAQTVPPGDVPPCSTALPTT
jgi:hypothetical protein